MIKKIFLILILSCTVGAGYVLAGTDMGDSFPLFNTEVHHVPKKVSAVKLKSFYSKRKTSYRTTGFSSDQYSFFSVLNDPSLSKMVGLNGKIIKKHTSSPAPVRRARVEKKVPRKTPVPVSTVRIMQASMKVATPPMQVSKPKKIRRDAQRKSLNPILKPVQAISIPVLDKKVEPKKVAVKQESNVLLKTLAALQTGDPNPVRSFKPVNASLHKIESFVVQVSSFKQLQRSQELKGALEKKGYPAFIGKTELPGNAGAWYRVYIGRYFDHAGAEMAADRFYRKENHKAVVIRQTG
jgi:cell division septation protein DedD